MDVCFFIGHTKIMNNLYPVLLAFLIGCLMAAVSFLLNSYLLKNWNKFVFISLGPIIEEVSKSYLAWYLGANLILTHVIFGVIEGGYDLVHSRYGDKGCILSISGHTLFGLVTAAAYFASGLIAVGIILACFCHIGYNLWVVYHFTNK